MSEIILSKNLIWDNDRGKFSLSDEAQETIYREKSVICSYSGSCEWANHFSANCLTCIPAVLHSTMR